MALQLEHESIIVQIWIADFNINFNNLDKTPFEKIQNFIFKNILGVHNKVSNLAVKIELGKLPLLCQNISAGIQLVFQIRKVI
jgi:hypothetical protein